MSVYILIAITQGRLSVDIPSTKTNKITMSDFRPYYSTTRLITKLPVQLASAETHMNFQARGYIILPSITYWTDVEKLVNIPMKLDVAVDTWGSMSICSRIGPINMPPPIPSEPARIPATKTILRYL